MEKQPLLDHHAEQASPASKGQPTQPNTSRHRPWLIVLCLCIAASITRHIFFAPYPAPLRRTSPPPPFSWSNLESKPYLDYTPCFDGLQCARLEVPMDYFNGTTDAKVHLAVAKRPAQVNVTHPQYGGPVLLNPGGPGGSGIGLLVGSGGKIVKIIDTNSTDILGGGKFFDLISWDPRGVGETTPSVSCAKDPMVEQAWQIRVMEEGVLGSSDAGLGRLWSMAKARGGSCSLPPEDGSADLKRYANTASSATDMISIIEAHGQWRQKEAARLLGIAPPGKGPRKRIEVPSRLKWQRGGEKLQYWGFSYGTYLGMTFSAMYPERVERVVVDGVVDPYDYRKALWYDNLIDTEKDMDQFYSNCARVGYPACALANETSVGKTTPEGVKARAAAIIEDLYHNPLPVVGENPEVITYSDVRNLVFGSVYSPIESFPFVANTLADIEKGNGTTFAQILRDYHVPYCPASDRPSRQMSSVSKAIIDPIRNNSKGAHSPLSSDALTIISCTDGDSQANLTKKEFEKHLQKEIKLSPSIGAMWSTIRMDCVHFSIRAHHRFTAPFAGNTSNPLLFIGNTADPVTPGRNAVDMAKAYDGAGVIMQNSPGHCSLSAASRCTVEHVREYFQTGKVPNGRADCEPDEMPFGKTAADVEVESQETRDVRDAVEALRRGMVAAGGFGRGGW